METIRIIPIFTYLDLKIFRYLVPNIQAWEHVQAEKDASCSCDLFLDTLETLKISSIRKKSRSKKLNPGYRHRSLLKLNTKFTRTNLQVKVNVSYEYFKVYACNMEGYYRKPLVRT